MFRIFFEFFPFQLSLRCRCFQIFAWLHKMAVANLAIQRIKREIRDMANDVEAARCGVKINPISDDNWMNLHGEIAGPPNTPYAGGTFQLEIIIPESYPFIPPKVKFLTKIWHPNISSVTGAICVDILKDQWAAAMTLRTVLLSLQALLSAPEPDDPQDAVVASQYKNSNRTFVATAQHWTSAYAGGPSTKAEYEKMVQDLISMGFPESLARSTLSQANWNYEVAVALCTR